MTEQKIQRNKYLDDLGFKPTEYGTNYLLNDDRQDRWAKEREMYGFDERETWNLCSLFVEWLYSHCMMYKEINCVDLSYHKIEYNGVEYTQEEALDLIVKYSKDYLFMDKRFIINGEENISENMALAIHLWAELFPLMWW